MSEEGMSQALCQSTRPRSREEIETPPRMATNRRRSPRLRVGEQSASALAKQTGCRPGQSCYVRPMRIPGAVIVLSSALSIVAFAQPASPTLKLVSTAWPPFTNAAGQPRFALDLVEAAFGRFGITANTTIVDPGQFTPSLLGTEYDGSAA